mmetsp:Transcript_18480/g.32102  ORF Transcript_18480/g.32102 Transcript_18480/m.32102 type:complete len:89 (-) Transcript_18480:53-319(-)
MNLGKCWKCNKSVYQLEGFKFGAPGHESITHKGCFKCVAEGCGWQLELGTYKAFDNLPYCKNHYPVTGFGDAKQNAQHAKPQGTRQGT